MTVVANLDQAHGGLAAVLGGLIEQNVQRDPSRRRLLRPAVVSIEAVDADTAVTMTIAAGRVTIAAGATPSAHLRVAADSEELLRLTAAPLRFGVPDVLRPEGRAIARDLIARRIRVRGLVRHPRRLARLTMLLSVTR